MGCDIHLFAEMKGVNGWVPIKKQIILGDRVEELGWLDVRSYRLFSMMADVRNGWGIEPIADPRGIPVDASKEIMENPDDHRSWGHSHSYFTLRELLDLESEGYWSKSVMIHGCVHGFESIRHLVISQEGQNVLLSGPPSMWSQSILGPAEKEIFYVRWISTYRSMAGPLLKLIEELADIAEAYQLHDFFDIELGYCGVVVRGEQKKNHWVDLAERVRIIFWFDN